MVKRIKPRKKKGHRERVFFWQLKKIWQRVDEEGEQSAQDSNIRIIALVLFELLMCALGSYFFGSK